MLRIAITGRPNVGKSTLFNVLAGRRISITDARAGTTRDLVEAEVEIIDGRDHMIRARLVDTGGMGVDEENGLGKHIEEQIKRGIETADILLVMVDVRTGVAGHDVFAAETARQSGKPSLLLAAKTDDPPWEAEAANFYSLGLGDPLPISAVQRYNLGDLYDRLLELAAEHFPEEILSAQEALDRWTAGDEEQCGPRSRRVPGPMRIAVVGRRNAGKSTFFNRVAGYDRVIVSEVPGTTRDSVETDVEFAGISFSVVDTAGLVRKREGRAPVEFYSSVRTEQAIRRADVVLLLMDCTEQIGRIDRHAYAYAHDCRKPLIFVINKWDLSNIEPAEYLDYLEKKLPFASRFPVAFISALEGDGLEELVQTAYELFLSAGRTLGTGVLNRILAEIVSSHQVPIKKTRLGKIYYLTQTGVHPPEFTVFVNRLEPFGKDYVRYLEHSLAEALGAPELPVRVVLRERKGKKRRAGKR